MKRVLAVLISLLIGLCSFSFGEETSSPADRAIALDADSFVIYAGKQQKITATVNNLKDSAPKQTNLVWESSDAHIAMVNNAGLVTGKSEGSATITVKAKDNDKIFASASVEVRVPVQSVAINEKNADVVVGGSEKASKVQLTVTIKPENAYHQTGTWTSTNESIATVDEKGLVTGITAGNATITYTSDDPASVKKAQIQVKVGQAVQGIAIEGQGNNLPVPKTMALKATVEPANATNKKLEWSSADESVATVNASGQVKAVGAGNTIITATATDGTGISQTYEINVVAPVKKIGLSEKKVTLAPDVLWPVQATITPEDATIRELKWSSSNERVATVDDYGNITGVAKGNARITVSAVDGSNVKETIAVTVKDFDFVITTSSGATASWSPGNGIWAIAYRSKNKRVSSGSEKMLPLKTGPDTFTILAQSYMTHKIKKKSFSVLVTPAALGIGPNTPPADEAGAKVD